MNRRHNISLMLLLLALTAAAPGCNVINTLRAKDSLNEGVQEFNKAKYDLAEQKFNQALELNPDMPNAEVYRAQAIFQQFKELKLSDETADKVQKEFNRTLGAYDKILEKYKDNPQAVDQAYALKADAYDHMTKLYSTRNPQQSEEYKQQRFKLLLDRAALPNASNQVKASVYYNMGKYAWDKTRDITTGIEASADPEKFDTKRPLTPDEIGKLEPLSNEADQFFRQAIQAMPEWADPHSMLRLTLRQKIYILNSSPKPDPAVKDALIAEYKEQGEIAELVKDSEQTSLMRAK